jgi:hypothetical protein
LKITWTIKDYGGFDGYDEVLKEWTKLEEKFEHEHKSCLQPTRFPLQSRNRGQV